MIFIPKCFTFLLVLTFCLAADFHPVAAQDLDKTPATAADGELASAGRLTAAGSKPADFLTAVRASQDWQETEYELISLLDQRDRQIKNLLGPRGTEYTQEQRDKLTGIINDIVDYHSMARYALQETYDTIDENTRRRFVDLFSTIIRQQSLEQLDIYRAEVIYNDVSRENGSAIVETTAILDNVRTPVFYAMEQRDDEWVIIDMAVDNVWTAESYRRSFQNQIRRRGFDALLQNLERRAEREL